MKIHSMDGESTLLITGQALDNQTCEGVSINLEVIGRRVRARNDKVVMEVVDINRFLREIIHMALFRKGTATLGADSVTYLNITFQMTAVDGSLWVLVDGEWPIAKNIPDVVERVTTGFQIEPGQLNDVIAEFKVLLQPSLAKD